MNYYINSNSGDYITENNGEYILTLIPRIGTDGKYMHFENKVLTLTQFKSMKGFVPIKQKKMLVHRRRGAYLKTPINEGLTKRVEVPTIAESRDRLLKELGL